MNYERNLLEVDEISGDVLVVLVHDLQVAHEPVVGLLMVAYDGQVHPDALIHRPVDLLGGRLAVVAGDCQSLLVGIKCCI